MGSACRGLLANKPILRKLVPAALAQDLPAGQVCEEDGRAFGVVLEEERAKVDFDGYPETYLADVVSKRKAEDQRRRRRQLDELWTASFEASDGSVALQQWIDEIPALEASGWKGEAGSALCSQRARAFGIAIDQLA